MTKLSKFKRELDKYFLYLNNKAFLGYSRKKRKFVLRTRKKRWNY